MRTIRKCHEALITETRHFGVLLEIPRLQIKGLIKPDKLPAAAGCTRHSPTRWKSDHGSVLCAGLRIPRHSRESGPGTAVGGFYPRLTGGTAAAGKDSLPRQKGEAHARPQAAEPLTASRPQAGTATCGR